MRDHYGKIFSGYLLTLFDINIGSFDLLPDVLGYLLIAYGLYQVSKNVVTRSSWLGIMAAILLGALSLTTMIQRETSGLGVLTLPQYWLTMLGMTSTAVLGSAIYHMMIRHMAIIDDVPQKESLGREYTHYLVINGIILLMTSNLMVIPLGMTGYVVMSTVVLGFILSVRLALALNRVKKSLDMTAAGEI